MTERKTITLKSFAELASKTALEKRTKAGKPVPPPDVFDDKARPFGVLAGDNKHGFTTCPTCGKPPTTVPQPIDVLDNDAYKSFLFKNELSAREYTISGMCQACQDDFFGPDEQK